jgi:hypothetical protein
MGISVTKLQVRLAFHKSQITIHESQKGRPAAALVESLGWRRPPDAILALP